MNDISGIAGVIIWTAPERHRAMAAFYRDAVGLPVRSDRAGFINFDFDGVRLTIAEHSDVSGQSSDPLRTMVNFAVVDISRVHDRLMAAGIEFIRRPEQEPWGGWIATFSDPDGNTVQLMQTS